MHRIGYDAKRLFNNFTGLGNYSRTLLGNTAEYYPDNAYHLYSPKITKNEETQYFLNNAMFDVHEPNGGLKSWWRLSGIKKDLRKHNIDLFHGLSHEIPLGIDKTGIRSVVTIHDLVFKRYPHYFPVIDRKIYDMKFRYACRHADRIVAISESTKKDIIYYYDTDPGKIEVVYQSVDERFMREKAPEVISAVLKKYQLPDQFLLYVGSIIARKNLLNLVKALSILPKAIRLPLVGVGQGKGYKQKVQEYISKQHLEKDILFAPIDFDDLPAIYQKAAAFIYPSYYEGFGIPLMESLFSQTPVVTSNLSSLPEAGGPGASLVDPDDPESIAGAIAEILEGSQLRQQKIEMGNVYAREFLAEPLTRQMMELYERVIGGSEY